MQLIPNKTLIKAAIIEVVDSGNFLKIVILQMPSKHILPAFLNVGKIIIAQNLLANTNKDFKVEDLISVEIEVIGDPFKQTYILHKISKISNS